MEFMYHNPRSIQELAATLDGLHDYALLAGGTDLLVKMKGHRIQPGCVVDISKIEEFRGIVDHAGTFSIGPLVTHTELAESPDIQEYASALAEAADQVGSPQIRNRGTVGGNIGNSSPAADTVPAMLALGARVEIQSLSGKREQALNEVFLGPGKNCLAPGEFIARVFVPKVKADEGVAFIKYGKRKAQAIAVINGAAWLKIQNGTIAEARIALGSVAPTAIRLYEVEKWLVGQKPEAEVFAQAANMAEKLVRPISDVRCGATHRVRLTRTLVENCLKTALTRVKELCKCG